ncbi:MAG: DUF1013 domain-containing protein [Alphaproteobacteria bacterium]|nr:DUF1013 domain-containing protein [Alphaproteobacteria bacterium]
MSDRKPLMPKATAVWLVDNTALTFDQIADLCGLHPLEVKGIADGDVAQGIKGMDPVSSGQLTRDEIERGEADSSHKLRMAEQKVILPQTSTRKKRPRYTPVSRRHDRPNAVLWLLRQHPELKDSQIIRLVGTTKPTITQIRDRTHWNSPNLVPQDPVTLGLCKQVDLDAEVQKAAKRVEANRPPGAPMPGGGLLPASETVPGLGPQPDFEPVRGQSEAEEEAEVFASLQKLSSGQDADASGDQPDVEFPEFSNDDDDQPEVSFAAGNVAGETADEAAPGESAEGEEEGEVPAEDYGLSAYVDAADAGVVEAIVKFCGIALRSTDASLVSCSSKDELARVRDSFMKKKLALELDDETLDAAIAEVCERMKDTRRKHRVVFYYLLAEKFEMLEALKG